MTTFTVDSTALFTLVAIAAGVGFFVGLAMAIFRRSKPDSKPPQKGLLEVARIWRDKFDGKLWLQVDEKSGSRLEDFSGEDRAQAVKIVNGLAGWIERPEIPPPAVSVAAAAGVVMSAGGGSAPPPAALAPEGTPAAFIPEDSGPIPPLSQQQVPMQSVSPAVQNQQPANRPRVDIVKGIRLTFEGDAASKLEKAQNRSIAAQVDEILQEKIKGTALEQKAIRLMELPGKGMVVMVGLEQYDSLEAVPYPDVKGAIRYCVAQWEKKMLG